MQTARSHQTTKPEEAWWFGDTVTKVLLGAGITLWSVAHLLLFVDGEDLVEPPELLLHALQLRVRGDGQAEQLLRVRQLLALFFEVRELFSELLQQLHAWREIPITSAGSRINSYSLSPAGNQWAPLRRQLTEAGQKAMV